MKELRLDGRTAIVTGAGGNPGLGRSYALMLAARGAKVVVNDIGSNPDGIAYEAPASAEAVVEEIRARDGTAVADTHSVATEDGARRIVQTAIDAFGSADILINNAVVTSVARFDEYASDDIRRQVEVNLMGPIWACRAAWPHMRERGYGRIINISSPAFTGVIGSAAYALTKGGVYSLTRSLAAEGAPLGIKANILSPGGFTRSIAALWSETSEMYRFVKDQLPPDLVAPVVVYLSHEECAVSGECIEAAGGSIRRVYVSKTPGITEAAPTVESVAARWDEVMAGAPVPVVAVTDGGDCLTGAKPYRHAAKV